MRRKVPFLVPVLAATCLCGTAGAAFAQRLPDSGKRACYESVPPYAQIPCAGAGADGAPARKTPGYTDNGDGTVTDNTTGLTWQQQDDGGTYTWYQATGTKHEKFNPTGIDVCGSFGRLPSKEELTTILDSTIAYPGPNIHPVFSNAKANGYWTSTAVENSPGKGWLVNFCRSSVITGGKNLSYYVRCVRGGQ